MTKMKRKIIIGIVLIIIFTASFGIIYLNNVYLPIKVKGQLAKALSTNLNYNVEIEKIKYSPIRGAVIQNIIIYDKVKDKENTILTVKEASFQFLFLPLIKERKIIIPIIHIDSPTFNIRYQQDNTFNFSKIFTPKPKPKSASKIKFSFLVYKINIFDGKGIFEDQRMTPKFTRTIQDLDIVIGIRQLTKIGVLIDSKILTGKEGISSLSLNGNYNLVSKEVDSKLNLSNFVITEFNQYLKTIPLSISSGTIDNSAIEFKFKDNILNLKGSISTKGLGLRKEKLALIGDINIEPDLSYSINKKTLDYKANIKIIQASLNGLEYIDKLNNISGDIEIIKNRIWTDNIKLQAVGSNFTFKGLVENFGNPHVKLNLKSEQVSLEKILAILPFKTPGINLNGTAAADINIEGHLGNLPLDTTASLQINTAKLEIPFLKNPLNNIKGRADLTLDAIDWVDVSFDYLNTAYTSTGEFVNFKTPQITFSLNSKDLDLKSDTKIKDKIVRIITFAGKYLNSGFDIEGAVDTQYDDNPAMDLTVNLSLVPPDAFIFLPGNLTENLKKLKLDGILNIKGTLNGEIKNYKTWNISSKVAADTLSIYGLRLSNLSFNLEDKNATVILNHFIASGYTGLLNLAFISDLNPEIPSYSLKFSGSGIDLAKLKLDTGLKDKDLSGLLDISTELKGNFKDQASLKGNGLLSIKDGRLWQLNLFKGLGELFLLPDHENIVFKEAFGEFDIADKSISTENLRLTSEQLTLDCKGKVGFDGTLNFTIYTEANKNIIRDSSDIRKFTAAILGELGNALTIKVNGTIQKPKYKIVPVAADLIRNLKDFFLGK